jgi:hypothetical protein
VLADDGREGPQYPVRWDYRMPQRDAERDIPAAIGPTTVGLQMTGQFSKTVLRLIGYPLSMQSFSDRSVFAV